MVKEQFEKLLALSLKKKLIAALILLGLIILPSAGYVKIKSNININKNNDKEEELIYIKPSISLDTQMLDCIYDNGSLVANIETPTDQANFLTTDSISLNGNFTYECKDPESVKFSWYWDNSNDSFSTDKTANLSNLKEGWHTIRFVSETDKIESADEVIVNITKPTVAGTSSTQPTPQPQPQPAPNQAPSVVIMSPKDGSTYTATQYDKLRRLYVPVSFRGNGSDPEDGALSGTSLEWYYEQNGGPRVLIGTGTSVTAYFYPKTCADSIKVILKGIDSKGLTVEQSINLTIYQICIY